MQSPMTYESITGNMDPYALYDEARKRMITLAELAAETAASLVGNTITEDERDEATAIILDEIERHAPLPRTYTYREISPADLSSADLREAYRDQMITAYSVTVWDGDKPHAEGGELVIFDNDRFGFAWGADAQWGDVDGDHLLFDERDQYGDYITMPLPE